MDRFIGIDVHLQSCTLAVKSKAGKRVCEQRVETNGEALTAVLKGIAGRKYVCLEEGTYSEWLFEVLRPIVCETVVVQPEKKRGPKSDSRDAWDLAEQIRTRRFRPVYKPAGRFTELREAVRAHRVVLRDVSATKNKLNALYRSRGVLDLSNAIYDPDAQQPWLAKLPKHHRRHAELLSGELKGLLDVHAQAEQWLLDVANRTPEIKRLTTAPGIGPIRAAQVVAIVVSPHRFRTKRQFWSYCGLAVVTRSSSDYQKDSCGRWVKRETAQTRGLNRNRHPVLKNVFKGAAVTVISQMSTHPLNHSYQRMVEGSTKPNLARLTIARRIAAAALAMWKNQEDYNPAKHEQTEPT